VLGDQVGIGARLVKSCSWYAICKEREVSPNMMEGRNGLRQPTRAGDKGECVGIARMYDGGDTSSNEHEKEKPDRMAFYNNSVARPVPNTTIAMPIDPPTLHRRCPPLVADRLRFATVATCVTFLSGRVGNIFGVVETWNCGASGLPSNWKRCSLYPVTGSRNICHNWYSSVSL